MSPFSLASVADNVKKETFDCLLTLRRHTITPSGDEPTKMPLVAVLNASHEISHDSFLSTTE